MVNWELMIPETSDYSSPVQVPGTDWTTSIIRIGNIPNGKLKLMEHYGHGEEIIMEN